MEVNNDNTPLICTVTDNGIARITLNRPAIHNAFDDQLITDLTDTLKRLNDDGNVRVVQLTGAGKAFLPGRTLTG